MKYQRGSHRSAFTLIELVASAVLAAMMMAALLSVVWSAVRESNQLRQSEINDFPVTLLVEQIRVDFQNARGMAIDPSGVTLHGYLGRDARTLQPLLIPGRVRYEVRSIGGRGVLTRSGNGVSTEPVWYGFSAMRVDPLAESDPENESLPEPETGGLPEVPLSFRVTMLGDRGQILWREVIHHHES